VESEIPQTTDQWKLDRLGKATASRISDVTAKTKTGWGASRANYMAQIIAERLTGVPYATYTNDAMKWGIDQEPKARDTYEFFSGNKVVQVGFIHHPRIAMSGASPDGIIGEDGLTEIKCPNTATHIETLLGEPIEKKYLFQMQWQMACTGRQWCDFVSFDPRLPIDLQLKTQRIMRDNTLISSIETEVTTFLAEVDAKLAQLSALQEAA
jgi:putative phage-type endonuclease